MFQGDTCETRPSRFERSSLDPPFHRNEDELRYVRGPSMSIECFGEGEGEGEGDGGERERGRRRGGERLSKAQGIYIYIRVGWLV